MIKWIARGVAALVVLLVALALAVGINTMRRSSVQLHVPPAPPLAVDEAAVAQRLAAAVRLRTISSEDDPNASDAEFKKLHADLAAQFPRVHSTLKREVVGTNTLLYTWPGTDPAAKAVALMAHQDVVPIAPGTEKLWEAAPFGGEIRDGYVWGRGAWDDKGNLFAQLEAVEALIAGGFRPRQTVYLVMGHNEEIGTAGGARMAADLLKSRGVRLEWVMDEGLLIVGHVFPGLDVPAAIIGLAEKGWATYSLELDAAGGHASMPAAQGAIGMMGAALARIEAQQLPASLDGIAVQMFDTLAPEMTGPNRVFLSNLWLFSPVIKRILEKGPSTNAIVRTTTALTVVSAGNKENVVPGHAEATVNARLLPGDTVAGVKDHLQRVVANDAIRITARPGSVEASAVAGTEAVGYRTINRTIREVFTDAIVAPGLMVGGTDSRHFGEISDSIYKFSPVRADAADLPRFHGTNERISVKNYAEMIRFYHQLLQNASRKELQ